MDDDTLTALTDAANLRLAALWRDLEIALPAPRITRAMARCVAEAIAAAQTPAATRPPQDWTVTIVPLVEPAPATNGDAPAANGNAAVEREPSERTAVPPPDPDPEPPPPPRRRPHSPATRQKLREAAQARMARPGERERMAAIARARRPRQAAAAQPANGDTPTAQLLATAPPGDAAHPRGRPHGPMAIDEAAVLACLQRLAADGVMPTRFDYDERRGDAPCANTLIRRRPWSAWARLAGLRVQRGGGRSATDPAPAPTAVRVAARKAAAAAARRALLQHAGRALAAMAPDGHMPTLPQYDAAKPDSLPLGGELLHRLGLDSWGELAHACGLVYRNGESQP